MSLRCFIPIKIILGSQLGNQGQWASLQNAPLSSVVGCIIYLGGGGDRHDKRGDRGTRQVDQTTFCQQNDSFAVGPDDVVHL